MASLVDLSETLVELKKEFEKELALLDSDKLGRGKYLKAKAELKSQSKYRLLDMSRSGASKDSIEELRSALKVELPNQLSDFLSFSNGFDADKFFIDNCAGILSARENQKIMIEVDEVFPREYMYMFEFARDAKMPIGVWLRPGSGMAGQVFLHDILDRRIYRIATSMNSFFSRVNEFLTEGQQPSFISVIERFESKSNESNDNSWISDEFFSRF